MPMTPFHMALAAPLKAVLGKRFNATAFLAANIVIDAPVVYRILHDGMVIHGEATLHDSFGAWMVAIFLWGTMFRSWWGAVGATIGVVSHLALDSSIYPEMGFIPPYLVDTPWVAELGCVVLGLMGAAALHQRHPNWWRVVGFREIVGAIGRDMRGGNCFTVPLAVFMLMAIILTVFVPEYLRDL